MGYIVILENAYIKTALGKCKRNDLAVVDTDGCESLVKLSDFKVVMM